MSETKSVDILILGSGTAATNAARAALKAGAKTVTIVHLPNLTNTCVEEGCMPSKSILAGSHKKESLETIETTRNAHISRLRTALTDSFADGGFSVIVGEAQFVSDNEVLVKTATETTEYSAQKIIIATGSEPFVPPIIGLDVTHERVLVSDDVVSERAHFSSVPQTVLIIGAGPIGLELATFFHDIGSQVEVLNRTETLLPAMDSEFGLERHRASQAEDSFPIRLNANVVSVKPQSDGALCVIDQDGQSTEKRYDYILVATGRTPRITSLGLSNTSIVLDERGRIVHDETLRTTAPHIWVAGDVTGHHQILHYAAEMGKVAGHNAVSSETEVMNYDQHMLAVSFDQFPSAFIGLTETEARKRGIEVVTATRDFKNIGLGILKRQEYGLWKLVVEQGTGRILGSQVIGPEVAGELVQLLVPIIANQNTVADIINMTWYHPTYAEILLSLARDIDTQLNKK